MTFRQRKTLVGFMLEEESVEVTVQVWVGDSA